MTTNASTLQVLATYLIGVMISWLNSSPLQFAKFVELTVLIINDKFVLNANLSLNLPKVSLRYF